MRNRKSYLLTNNSLSSQAWLLVYVCVFGLYCIIFLEVLVELCNTYFFSICSCYVMPAFSHSNTSITSALIKCMLDVQQQTHNQTQQQVLLKARGNESVTRVRYRAKSVVFRRFHFKVSERGVSSINHRQQSIASNRLQTEIPCEDNVRYSVRMSTCVQQYILSSLQYTEQA